MTIVAEDRPSDSPYVEEVSFGQSLDAGSTVRPSEAHWHMTFVRAQGRVMPIITGPLPGAGVVSWEGGGEILWIKFKLGVFMPRLPVRGFLNIETTLPDASARSFWLGDSAWEYPTFENVETFVQRLMRQGILAQDPAVEASLRGEPVAMPARTLRHRFLRATGLTYTEIQQIERAKQAAALLRQGASILDTVFDTGYFDQPHLTRALRRWIGYTPAALRPTDCRSVQDHAARAAYHADIAADACEQVEEMTA